MNDRETPGWFGRSRRVVSLVDFLRSVHHRETASCLAFSAMLGEDATGLIALTQGRSLDPTFALTAF